MEEKWYHLTVEQVAAKLKTDINTGLNEKNAADRLNREGPNTVYNIPRVHIYSLCKDVLKDPTVFMLLCTVILGAIFDQAVFAGLIIALILINWAFCLMAYIKAKSVIAKGAKYALPTATVLRCGKEYIVKQDKVCRGDVIILNKGDIVPADARVIESRGLVLNEGSLTGDYTPKQKNTAPLYGNSLPYNMQTDMVFATTSVIAGRGKAVVCKKGRYNAAVEEKKVPLVSESHELPALKKLKTYSSVWSMVSLVIIFVLTAFEFVLGFGAGDLYSIFCTALALCAAGMCELYTVFGYIIIGRGLYGLSLNEKDEKNNINIKYSKSIDTISRITTLVLPKEGAFIAGGVHLEKLWCDNTLMSASEKRLEKICRDLVCCALDSTAYGKNDYEKAFNRFKAKNCTEQERIILNFATHLGIFGFGYTAAHMLLEHKEEPHIGNVSKSLITDGKRKTIVMRGGIDDILPLCASYRSHEDVKSIKNEKQNIKDAVNRAIKEGYNVICVASKRTEVQNLGQAGKDRDFVFEGFLAISEPRLPGAKENIALMKKQGINVIMLCDEADASNRSYAKSLGIISDEEEIMTGTDFKRISELNFEINAGRFKYYEALDTVQKRRLISLLRKNGEVVGCFGNDFEDISMLKEANVGYSTAITLIKGNVKTDLSDIEDAIGINSEDEKSRSCEALKQESDVIIPSAGSKKGGFNAVVSSIIQARSVLLNLNNMVRYLVCTQSARICTVLGALVITRLGLPGFGIAPMSALQLLFSGLILDLYSVVLFAFTDNTTLEKNTSLYYKKPRQVTIVSFILGLWWAAASIALPLTAYIFGTVPAAYQGSTMLFYGSLLTYPVVAAEIICTGSVIKEFKNLNKLLLAEVVLAVLLIVLTALIRGFGRFFCTVPLNAVQWLLTFLQPIIVFAVFELSKMSFVKENAEVKESEENADA